MIFWPKTSDVCQEPFYHIIDLVIRPVQKDPVLVGHRVLLIPSSNLEIFPKREDSLWDEIQDITSRIGIVKILDLLQYYGSEVMGGRRTVDIRIRGTKTVVGIIVHSV